MRVAPCSRGRKKYADRYRRGSCPTTETISYETSTKASDKIRNTRIQADALSCSFFNILLEMIMVSANINTGNIIYNKSSQILAYADDIDVIGRSSSTVVEQFLAIEQAADSCGLKVNGGKTKYMLSSSDQQRHNDLGSTVTMGPHNIEVVKSFIYLGSEITSDNDISAEVKRRIILASRCLGGIRKLMRSKHLSHKTKLQLYHQLILPVLLYGAESWSLRAAEEQNLLVFERKVLRMICGGEYATTTSSVSDTSMLMWSRISGLNAFVGKAML